MAQGPHTDHFKLPAVEFGLADGRVTASAVGPFLTGAAPAGTPGLEIVLSDIRALILVAEGMAARAADELPSSLITRDRAYRRHVRASRFPLSLVLGSRQVALAARASEAEAELVAKVAQRNRCYLDLRFNFGDEAEASFFRLAATFDQLTRARSLWRLPDAPKGSVIAAASLRRDEAKAAPAYNEFLHAGVPGFSFAAAGETLELYPGFFVTGVAAEPRLATVLQVTLAFAELDVIEPGSVPADALRQGSVWEMTNKDGTRDKRYANNRQIPIMRYGRLKWSAPGEASRTYLISDVAAAKAFATAFANYQAALFAESNRPPPPGGRRRLGASSELIGLGLAVAKVPPPPAVSAAHELILAPLLGAVAAWLVLSVPMPTGVANPNSGAPNPSAATISRVTPEPAPLPHPPVAVEPALPVVVPAITPGDRPGNTLQPDHPAVPAESAREQVRTRAGANVRSAPNGAADVVRTVIAGARLGVFTRSGGWVRVGETEAWGWIHSSLLEPAN